MDRGDGQTDKVYSQRSEAPAIPFHPSLSLSTAPPLSASQPRQDQDQDKGQRPKGIPRTHSGASRAVLETSRAAPRGVYLSIATNQSIYIYRDGISTSEEAERENGKPSRSGGGLTTHDSDLTRISIQSCFAYTTRHRTPSRSQSKKRHFQDFHTATH